jgi:hypothetical protein
VRASPLNHLVRLQRNTHSTTSTCSARDRTLFRSTYSIKMPSSRWDDRVIPESQVGSGEESQPETQLPTNLSIRAALASFGVGSLPPEIPVFTGSGGRSLAPEIPVFTGGAADEQDLSEDEELEALNDDVAHSQVALDGLADSQSSTWNNVIDGPDYAALSKDIPSDGFLPIIDAIWDDEIAMDSTITRVPVEKQANARYTFRKLASNTLCSMPEELIRVLIMGNIARTQSSDVEQYLSEVTSLAMTQPAIYVRSFVDSDSESPTVGVLLGLVTFIECYCDVATKHDDDTINQIVEFDAEFEGRQADRAVKWLVQSGQRHFNLVQRKKFTVWANSIKRRCQRAGSDVDIDNLVLPEPPLTYTRYSKQTQQHDKSMTSNFNKVMQTYFRLFVAGEYSFRNRVVCVLGEYPQLAMAEITIAALARSNYRHGGTCAAAPGQNMGSSMSADDASWTAHAQALMQKTPLRKNWALEARRIQAFSNRTNSVKQEEDRLLAELAQLRKEVAAQKQARLDHVEAVRSHVAELDRLVASGADPNGMMMAFARKLLDDMQPEVEMMAALDKDGE